MASHWPPERSWPPNAGPSGASRSPPGQGRAGRPQGNAQRGAVAQAVRGAEPDVVPHGPGEADEVLEHGATAGTGGRLHPGDQDGARGRRQEAEHHRGQGALAGPVGSQDASYPSGPACPYSRTAVSRAGLP